jgi:hypothetical protein
MSQAWRSSSMVMYSDILDFIFSEGVNTIPYIHLQ